MVKLRWYGTHDELLAALYQLPGVLAGRSPDPTGLVDDMQLRLGAEMLSHIKDAYATKSDGGTDDMGITWEPLAASTLALRRKVTGAKTLSKLRGMLLTLPAHRKRLIQIQRNKLLKVYQAGGRQQRSLALRFLKAMRPFISASRFKTLTAELKKQTPARGAKLAFSGGFAQILRDTGRLFNSLSPGVAGNVTSAPGKVTVGSNVTVNGLNLLELHDSGAPRKLKKDGTPRLPRRQVLPDSQHPIPASWWADSIEAYSEAFARREFWVKFLGGKAR